MSYNPVFSGQFSVQNVSGSQYLIIRNVSEGSFTQFQGGTQVAFKYDGGISPALTGALSSSYVAGTGSYSYP